MDRKVVGAAVVAAGLGLAGAARGENRVTYSWGFVEVVAGTPGIGTPVTSPDGIIDIGEAARVVLSVSFTPGVGSMVTYTPPPGTGVGTVAGLGSIGFDLIAAPNVGGSWSSLVRDPAWRIGSAGTGQGGSVFAGQAGQLGLPGQVVNPMNPVPAIWMGVWTPGSYLPRTARFDGHDPGFTGFANHILAQFGTDPQTGDPLYMPLDAFGTWGSLEVPVVPGPGVGIIVAVAGGWWGRRRHACVC